MEFEFQLSKCYYIQVGPPSRSCHHSYVLNSIIITSTDIQKDLGIWVDPNLSFHTVTRLLLLDTYEHDIYNHRKAHSHYTYLSVVQ